MADNEVTFVFHNTKYFWKFLNKAFDLSDMNDIFSKTANEGDYTILLAEQVPNEIYDCIDSDTGCLDTSNDSLVLLDLQDVYSNLDDGEMPYFNLNCSFIDEGNGGFTITLDSGSTSIQIQVGDSQTNYLQGMFLVKRETKDGNENFVMAYATIAQPINIRDFINVPFDGLLAGVGYCATK